MKKKVFLIIVVLFIGIQFIRPAKNLSSAVAVNGLANIYSTPPEVSEILKKACRDCHSNNTVYPWYAEVQPVAWWLNDHINEGKKELNLDEFATYSIGRQYKKLEECIDQVKEGEMPLWSYTLIHTNAKLTDAEKQTFIDWCQTIRDTIKAKYPADSLVLKRRPE